MDNRAQIRLHFNNKSAKKKKTKKKTIVEVATSVGSVLMQQLLKYKLLLYEELVEIINA